MRIIIAFCAFMSCHCSQYIQVGEKVLVGEDPKLARLLTEKTDLNGLQLRPMKLPRQYYVNKQLMETSLAVHNKGGGGRKSAYHLDYDELNGLSLNSRAVDLMRHAVYQTQYRMRDLQRIIDVYNDDASFRMGFTFEQLDHIIRNMRIMFSLVNNTLTTKETMKTMRYSRHIVNYSYFLKHNHDVTYIVENIIEIQTKIQLQAQKKAQHEKQMEKKMEEHEEKRQEQEEKERKRQEKKEGGQDDGPGGGQDDGPAGGQDDGPGGPEKSGD